MANKAPVRQSLALIVVVPLVLLVSESLAERGLATPGWSWAEWKVFLVGSLWSLSFWASLVLWGAWWSWKGGHRKGVAWALAALFMAWNTFAFFISYKYLLDMYHLPNVHILQFTIMEWSNAWELAKGVLRWWHLGLAMLGVGLCAFQLGNRFITLGPWLEAMPTVRRRLLLAVLSTAFVSLSALTLGWHRYQSPLPWDANWHRMFFQYGLMMGGNTTNLRVAHRPVLPAHPTAPGVKRPNVLVILNESLRADAILPEVHLWEGFSETLAPHIYGRVHSSDAYDVFPHAYANAGATNASVPSLLTGLPPEASTYDFHRHPTLWNYAKSLGYHTLLYTPQDWRWEHFDEFFLDRGVDVAVHRRHFEAPLVNDLGVDDGIVVDSLLRHLEQAPKDEPFFGVVQFNVTHAPFYGGDASEALPIQSRERYRPAVELLDQYQERLLAGLERLGLYDSTLVIYTSDHGENIRSRNITRLGSFYDESLRVPFWIKPPREPQWVRDHPQKLANLRAWTNHVVQNLDVLPTLLDFWDLPVTGPWGPYAGQSLFAPGANAVRVVGAQNTGEIRVWSPEGCFALKEPYKLVLLSHMAPQLFDMSHDPMEQHNLWTEADARAANLPWIRDYLRAMPGREQLCKRLGGSCPLELSTN
jgi:phosphoglycerol transferase MdoB-like AlkP superfamily enzyme